jgi:hypothetical protein
MLKQAAKRVLRSPLAAGAMFQLDRRLGRLRGESRARQRFAIGLLAGDDPMRLGPISGVANPVVTASMVSDIDAAFVADPFLLRRSGRWHLFFEVWNNHSHRGEIAWCESADGLDWHYRGIALREPFHLSYPLVFEAQGEIYLLPETHAAGEVRLYRASAFPGRWKCESILLRGVYCDATVFRHEDLWWMLAMRGNSPAGGPLDLFWSKELHDGWCPHPRSPLPVDPRQYSRPGGRVWQVGERLLRFAQSSAPWYGSSVSVFEIRKLSPTEYEEAPIGPVPLLEGSGSGWNREGMHHIDLAPLQSGGWLAAVDGWAGIESADWSARQFTPGTHQI